MSTKVIDYPVTLSNYVAILNLPVSLSKEDGEKLCRVIMALTHESAKENKSKL